MEETVLKLDRRVEEDESDWKNCCVWERFTPGLMAGAEDLAELFLLESASPLPLFDDMSGTAS